MIALSPLSGSTRTSGTQVAIDVVVELLVALVAAVVDLGRLALSIDEQCDRIVLRRLHGLRDLLVRVHVGRERQPARGQELARGRLLVRAVDAEERDFLAAFGGDRLEDGELLLARRAPGGPL